MTKHQIHILSSLIFILILIVLISFFKVSFWWIVLFIALQIPIFIYGVTNLQVNYFFKSISKGRGEKKQIALTFDDGPHQNTLEILELLKKNNANATFFCVGKNIEANPDILRKIDQGGHIIGNHTYSHSNTFDFFSTSKVLDEINKCNEQIKRIINKKPLLFRPPNGVSNPMIANALKLSGLNSIAWNIRSFDTFFKDEELVFKRISKKIKPGSIVLMHDTMPHTKKLVSKLIEYAQLNGYELVTVEKLLNLQAYE